MTSKRKPGASAQSYEVGYGKPPVASQFKKGQSGNPKGRTRKVKSKRPALNEEHFKSIVLEEAYRAIKVHEGGKEVTMPMAQAIVRSMAVSAAKGNTRAAQLFAQMVKVVEEENKELYISYFRSTLDYKDAWTKELQRRERLGVGGPEPIPHPDDLVIDARKGKVTIRGPMTEAEKDMWMAADIMKERYREIIRSNEEKLLLEPEHPESASMIETIRDAQEDLFKLDSLYLDEVTERIVRSRTGPDGEVTFVDPHSIMKLFKD